MNFEIANYRLLDTPRYGGRVVAAFDVVFAASISVPDFGLALLNDGGFVLMSPQRGTGRGITKIVDRDLHGRVRERAVATYGAMAGSAAGDGLADVRRVVGAAEVEACERAGL